MERKVGQGVQLRVRLGLLSVEELAEMLDVSPDTLREWRRTKQGPDYVRAGKGVMYRENDVKAWLGRNVVPVVELPQKVTSRIRSRMQS
jgi:predicted site-specific integrase-resolvase